MQMKQSSVMIRVVNTSSPKSRGHGRQSLRIQLGGQEPTMIALRPMASLHPASGFRYDSSVINYYFTLIAHVVIGR